MHRYLNSILLFLSIWWSIPVFSQDQNIQTRNYVPLINSSYERLSQEFEITVGDSIYTQYVNYCKRIINADTFLITQTYNHQHLLELEICEKVKKRGLYFEKGTIYNYDEQGKMKYKNEIKGRKRRTFPFVTLSSSRRKKYKYTSKFADIFKVKSHYLLSIANTNAIDTIQTEDPILVLYRRSLTYKRRFFYNKIESFSYYSFWIPSQGAVSYAKKRTNKKAERRPFSHKTQYMPLVRAKLIHSSYE